KNFHEIAGLSLIETVEVSPEADLMKQARSAGPICIPSAPDTFAVALVSDDQPLQGGIVEMQIAFRAQSLDCSDENQIRCAGAETRGSLRRQNKKFTRFKMC